MKKIRLAVIVLFFESLLLYGVSEAATFTGKYYARKGVYEFGGSISHHSSINSDATGDPIYIHNISVDPDFDYFIRDRIHIGVRPSLYYTQITAGDVNYDQSYGAVPSFRIGRIWGGPGLFYDLSALLGYAVSSTYGHATDSSLEHAVMVGLHPMIKYRVGNAFINIGLKYQYIYGLQSTYQYESSHVVAFSVGVSLYYRGVR